MFVYREIEILDVKGLCVMVVYRRVEWQRGRFTFAGQRQLGPHILESLAGVTGSSTYLKLCYLS
jgi:hypothetical protein